MIFFSSDESICTNSDDIAHQQKDRCSDKPYIIGFAGQRDQACAIHDLYYKCREYQRPQWMIVKSLPELSSAGT